MDLFFNPDELRVLGCLIEKRFSTPDAYPLTQNSLIAACSQSSNRDPVVHYDQPAVDAALKSTRSQGFSQILTSADSRVPRFNECLCEKLQLDRDQAAILAELLLRGPQTPGELRQRCSRMYEFPDLPSVDAALESLSQHEPPLVVQLARQPGKREARYAHLLAGPIESQSQAEPQTRSPMLSLGSLEERVAALERQLAEVLERLEGF